MPEIIKEKIDLDNEDETINLRSYLDKFLNITQEIADCLDSISGFLWNKDEYAEGIKEVIEEEKEIPEIKSTSSKIFDFAIKTETDKAILIRNNKSGLVAWIPRKALKFMDTVSITLQDWFKGKIKWQEDKSF